MKISIITVTYNSVATLRDTFESVLSQTHQDFEHWIIDGNSKDRTVALIKEYESRYGGRLHWISEPDNGLYDAMNKGISRATGEVIGILNSDDFFTSTDVLRNVSDTFESQGCLDAVYGDIHFVNDNDLLKSVRYYSSAHFKASKLRYGFMPAHPSLYVRREVYQQVGPYSLDFKIAADYDMCVRLFHNRKIQSQYIPMDFVTMRSGGISNASIKHRLLTTYEDVKACRRNGLYTNALMISVKYFSKIFEFLPQKKLH